MTLVLKVHRVEGELWENQGLNGHKSALGPRSQPQCGSNEHAR